MSEPQSTEISEEQQLGQYIPLHYHWQMLQDSERVEAFRETIEHFVRPGMHVVELGGGTGILSSFAARCGARVVCVERNPELVRTARRLIRFNGLEERIEVVQADAREFVPVEPVDFVICEMLHVGLVREKQTEVIEAFRRNHAALHGDHPIRFAPEATLLMIQGVQQDFDYAGYCAPVPLFQAPSAFQGRTRELTDPTTYGQFCYDESIPQRFEWSGELTVIHDGRLNAVRFLTQNLIGIVLEEGRTFAWPNQFLVVPLERPEPVVSGDRFRVSLDYACGGPLSALTDRLRVERTTGGAETARRRAA